MTFPTSHIFKKDREAHSLQSKKSHTSNDVYDDVIPPDTMATFFLGSSSRETHKKSLKHIYNALSMKHMRLYLWCSAGFFFLISSLFFGLKTWGTKSDYYEMQNELQMSLQEALTLQKKAKILANDDTLKEMREKLESSFDKEMITSWIGGLEKKYHAEMKILPPKETTHFLGKTFDETHHAHSLTFHIKTFTEAAFFNILKELTSNCPLYGEIQRYTLKRSQTLTDDILVKIEHGEDLYFFEGAIDMLVIAKARV